MPKKICTITWVLESRWHVEEGNARGHRAWLRIATWNSKEEDTRTRRIPGLRGRWSFLSFLFLIRRSTGFFLIAESAESLIQTDNKKDDEPSSKRTIGDPPTYRGPQHPHAGPTLSGNECVTSPLESASTFAYRASPLLSPTALQNLAGVEFFPLLLRATGYWLGHTGNLADDQVVMIDKRNSRH